MKLWRLTLQIQTIYYLVTAVWPLVDMDSFMAVSGQKTDIWLVKTVAVLLLAISCSFIAQLIAKTNPWPVSMLATACCTVLIVIDCYYALSDIISNVYLVDAGVQSVFLLLWLVNLSRLHRQGN